MSANDSYGDIETQLTVADIVTAVRAGFVVNDTGSDGEFLRSSNELDASSASVFDETDVDARMDADALLDALTALSLDGQQPPHPTGLILRKTVIEGHLNLSQLALDFPVRFDGCVFTGWITLDYAKLEALDLSMCAFDVQQGHLAGGAINARSVTIRNGLNLFGVRGLRQLFIVDSTIGEMSFSRNTLNDISQVGYGFRTVLDGTSIERFFADTDQVTDTTEVTIPPLGDPSRLTIGSLQAGASAGEQVTLDPQRLAAWIMAGSTGDRKKTSYSRQVWEAFAQALDRDAMESEATKLRVIGRRFGRSKKKSFLAKIWDWIVDATIGYGYANHRAFVIWIGLLVLTIATVAVSNAAGLLTHASEDLSSAGGIFLYSLAVVLSPIGTGGPQDWFFSGVPVLLAVAFSAMKIASIGLLGLFVSGITGIVSKK